MGEIDERNTCRDPDQGQEDVNKNPPGSTQNPPAQTIELIPDPDQEVIKSPGAIHFHQGGSSEIGYQDRKKVLHFTHPSELA